MGMNFCDVALLAKELLIVCRNNGIKLFTAESCTGGIISSALTAEPGASDVFECGLVTYSDASKIALLQVDSILIEQKSAVSMEVLISMLNGLETLPIADNARRLCIATTGYAGPSAPPNRKIGEVYIGCSLTNGVKFHQMLQYNGKRGEIQLAAAYDAVFHAINLLSRNKGE